jgi:hypothetical protein
VIFEQEADVFERIEELEIKVRRLTAIVEFHKLNEIPLKYRKAFPDEKEFPFFTAQGFKGDIPGIHKISPNGVDPIMHHVNTPCKEELDIAKEAMRGYATQSKKKKKKGSRLKGCVDQTPKPPTSAASQVDEAKQGDNQP